MTQRDITDKRHPLRIATWNIGNGTVKDAVRIARKSKAAAYAFQEASDKSDLVDALCAECGLLPIRGTGGPGQAATPLLYDPLQLMHLRPIFELMVPGQRVNRGTGPEHMKPKWLIGGRFIHRASRRRVAVGSTHRVAGQTRHGDTIRDRVAREHAAEVRETFEGYHGVPIVAGDWNSLPDDDSLAPLWLRGWVSDQWVDSKTLSTHGHWTPDHCWWRHDLIKHFANGVRRVEVDDRIRYVGHHTIDGTHSDHRPLIVDFELTARPR